MKQVSAVQSNTILRSHRIRLQADVSARSCRCCPGSWVLMARTVVAFQGVGLGIGVQGSDFRVQGRKPANGTRLCRCCPGCSWHAQMWHSRSGGQQCMCGRPWWATPPRRWARSCPCSCSSSSPPWPAKVGLAGLFRFQGLGSRDQRLEPVLGKAWACLFRPLTPPP